jgi:hypothetical protein
MLRVQDKNSRDSVPLRSVELRVLISASLCESTLELVIEV